MSFGNGSQKGNGRGEYRPRGKSICDHMRDAIADGKSARESADYVISKISMKRFSRKRLVELYEDLKSNPSHHDGAAPAPSADGVVQPQNSNNKGKG